MIAEKKCMIPPEGWVCTRAAGHEGPCAAHQLSTNRQIALPWQGEVDGTVVAEDVNGMLAIPCSDGVVYVSKEVAIDFFGLRKPIKEQEPIGYINPKVLGHNGKLNASGAITWSATQNVAWSMPIYRVAPIDMEGKYAPYLKPFVALMERELHANSGKGDRPGWLTMSRNTALLEVYYHLAKLQKAVRDNNKPDIQEYAADVANMTLMLADVCGVLPIDEPRPGVQVASNT